MSGYAPEENRRPSWEEWDYRTRPDESIWDERDREIDREDMRDEVPLAPRARETRRAA